MWALFVAAIVLSAPPEMTARTLDGREVAGAVSELAGGRVVLTTPQGPQVIAPDQILSLQPKDAPKPPTEPLPIRVELRDGSRVLASDYTVTGGQARLTIRDQAAGLPVKGVAVVRFKSETAVTKPQWAKILADAKDKKFDGDVIVIRKGENVDALDGVFHDVKADKEGKKVVEFELSGTTSAVGLERVDGMVYFHAAEERFPDPVCVATDVDGSQLRLKSIRLNSGKLELETLGGLKTTRALEQMARLDYSAGKVMYLGAGENLASDEMPPLRASGWTPSVSFPAASTVAPAYLPRSRNPWVGPGEKVVLGDKSYDRALHMRGGTEVEYALRGNYRRFHAVAGIHPQFQGAVQLKILADGKPLFDDTILKESGAKVLDFDVSGVRQLRIIAIRKYLIGDAIDLCDARVTK